MVVDPASRGRAQDDGEKIFNKYVAAGLDLTFADNAVEAGILDVFEKKLKLVGSPNENKHSTKVLSA
ncbi:MAG: hypothetical protein CSA33_01630 [Desulfobulbus propionicus]|nr:MAG: hypothetical protein CSA33_01630 [Desulfobulbus propionicus]